MTPTLARRIALATLEPVMFDIVYDTAFCVAAGRPVQVDYGFSVAEVQTARADRAVLAGVYREVSARQDFVTATLIARLGWLAGLAADGEAAAIAPGIGDPAASEPTVEDEVLAFLKNYAGRSYSSNEIFRELVRDGRVRQAVEVRAALSELLGEGRVTFNDRRKFEFQTDFIDAVPPDSAADRRRLDWLEEHLKRLEFCRYRTPDGPHDFFNLTLQGDDRGRIFAGEPTLRAAIDAAMAEWAAREGRP